MAREFEELTKDWPEEKKQKVEQRSKDLLIEDLKRQLAEAYTALEYYADKSKWSVLDNGDDNMNACWFEVDEDGYSASVGYLTFHSVFRLRTYLIVCSTLAISKSASAIQNDQL